MVLPLWRLDRQAPANKKKTPPFVIRSGKLYTAYEEECVEDLPGTPPKQVEVHETPNQKHKS